MKKAAEEKETCSASPNQITSPADKRGQSAAEAIADQIGEAEVANHAPIFGGR